MQQQISQFPAPGTPLYAELCRRQDAIIRSTAIITDEERKALLSDGVGLCYVPDVPRPIERPRYTPDGVMIVTPSITVFPPPPRPTKNPWYWRLIYAI
ncbi:hypothetical protein PLANPX_4190 [Lacipirellula parvula]|uniref:Uncharacterized protein n=1 Tax=Lacipirellula parvula TaxID=2650471 RepID=A0A5K7XDM4_9BACT|nr:hypothetical protein PLANPX_4190 [Lacipirellula parvula]